MTVIQIIRYIKAKLNNDIIFCRNLDAKLNLIGFAKVDYGLAKND